MGKLRGDLLQHRQKSSVDFERQDLCSGLGQRHREGAEARSDLEDARTSAGTGLASDDPGEVGVGQEVLAEGLSGTDAVPGGEFLE